MSVLLFTFVLYTVISFVSDMTRRRLSNRLVILGLILGVLIRASQDGWSGLIISFAGTASGFALALPLRLAAAIGSGDVKWFASAGAFLGINGVAILLGLSVVISGAGGIVWYACSHQFREQCAERAVSLLLYVRAARSNRLMDVREALSGRATRFPYMVSVLPSAMMLMLLSQQHEAHGRVGMNYWSEHQLQARISSEGGPELILEHEGKLDPGDVGEVLAGMLENQRISGLLDFRRDWIDGSLTFRYRVDGLRPLTSALRSKPIPSSHWEGFMIAISLAVEEANQYLIRDSEIVLHPDWIWVGQDIRFVQLMAVPLQSFVSPDSSWRQWKALYDCMLEYDLPERWREALHPNQWEPGTYSHRLWMDKLYPKQSDGIVEDVHEDEQFESLNMDDVPPQEPKPIDLPANSAIGAPISRAEDGETMRFSKGSISKDDMIRLGLAAVCWIAFALYPEFLTLAAGVLGSIPLGFTLWQRYYKGEVKEEAAVQETNDPSIPHAQLEVQGTLADRTVLLQSADETVALTSLLTTDSRNHKLQLELSQDNVEHTAMLELTEFPFAIGRGPDQVQHIMDQAAVSRLHMEFRCEGEQYVAVDLGSLNGSLWNDEPMKPHEIYPLQDGDIGCQVQCFEFI